MSQLTTTTPDIKSFFAKAQPAAKAKVKADLAKGTTKAKTATTPAGKQRLAAQIREKNRTKTRLSSPGELARCRAIVGGDMLAGALLYRMAHLFRTINPKLKRNSVDYLALSREDLAMSAGLSMYELKDKALPVVKRYAGEIVTITAMGRGADKKMWFTVDLTAYQAALDEGGYELKIVAGEGLAPYGK